MCVAYVYGLCGDVFSLPNMLKAVSLLIYFHTNPTCIAQM